MKIVLKIWFVILKRRSIFSIMEEQEEVGVPKKTQLMLPVIENYLYSNCFPMLFFSGLFFLLQWKGNNATKKQPEVFRRKSCSENLHKIHKKSSVLESFFKDIIKKRTFLKRDSNIGVFLWIYRNF